MSKKIMFNDRFHLTQAVLEGTKTMTRRLLTLTLDKDVDGKLIRVYPSKVYFDNGKWLFDFEGRTYLLPKENYPRYNIGEVVAIAQSYHNLNKSGYTAPEWLDHVCESSAGYENKMFVRADLMPHHIRITNIKVERLQDISDDDIMREGVEKASCGYYVNGLKVKDWGKEAHRETECGCMKLFPTPRDAFAAFIDKVCGKGTWKRNPWVVVHGFELVD